jgi:hypothetical protein
MWSVVCWKENPGQWTVASPDFVEWQREYNERLLTKEDKSAC